ncbi:MAG: NAD-dependent epimerase/dehydratase family protein [Bacteroidetes bacterium]|nr:NAD-dependent epimerase/dehydratase family protein [Bacteroidota bacterium]
MVLVTGANGLLGSYLVKELIRRGEHVRGLRRATSDMSLLDGYLDRIEWVEGDVRDIYALEEAMLGVDQVYHVAAMISMQPRDQELMMGVNAEGTANVVNAALGSDIKKFLYVSSVAAFGRPEGAIRLIDENIDVKDSKDNFAYYKSKLYAEREVWRGIAEGLNAVIINPSTILGGGFWNIPPNGIFSHVYSGLPFYTTGVNGFVDVRDVVEVAIRLMHSGIQAEKFIVSAENASFRDVMWMAADAMKVRRPFIHSGKLLGSLAWRFEAIKSIFSKPSAIITHDSVEIGQNDFYYSNDKVKKALDFTFRPLRETIGDVAALYLESHRDHKAFAILS